MTEVLYYAYWNGQALRDVFEAMAGIFSLEAFPQLSAVCVLLGFMTAVAAGVVKNEGRGMIRFVASTVLLWFILIVPKVSIVITDVRSEETFVVDNVPLGIAFPASLANRFGFWLASTYETAFSPVEAARFTKFGAVFPERVIEALSAAGPADPQTRAMTTAVLQGCVIPEAITDDQKAASLAASTNLWSTVTAEGWVNPARSVALPAGAVLRCPAALTQLERQFKERELPMLKRLLGARLVPDHADPGSVLAQMLPQSESLLLGLSRSMDESLRQSVLLAVLPQAATSFVAAADAPAALAVALSRAQGNLASEINYRTMASIAKESLPKIRNALEFVVIALFPAAALLTLALGQTSAMILRGSMTLLLAVQIWPAVASVVNHLIIAADSSPFGALAAEFGGNSLASLALIRETGATSQAIAGALMCMVPMISYALVRAGDVAASSLVSGLMAPAQSASSAQGASLAAGNIQQGNVRLSNTSWNTHRANKTDFSAEATASDAVVSKSAYGTITRDGSGAVTGMTRTAVDFGLSQSTSETFGRHHSQTVSTHRGNAKTESARFVTADAAATADASERGYASSSKGTLSQARTVSSGESRGRESSFSLSASEETSFARTDRAAETTSVTSGGSLALGIAGAASVRSGSTAGRATGTAQNQTAGSSLTESGKTVSALNLSGAERSGETVGVFPGRLGEVRIGTRVDANAMQSLADSAASGASARHSSEQRETLRAQTGTQQSATQGYSEEGVQNASRRFSRSVSASDAAVREDGRTATSRVETAGALAEDRTAATHTTVDRGVSVMRHAIRQHGTPEAALRAAYAENVSVTAGAVHAARNRDDSSDPYFGTSSIPSSKEQIPNVYEMSESAVPKAVSVDQKRLERAMSSLPTAVTPNEERKRETQLRFESTYADEKSLMARHRRNRTSDAAFERGLLLLTREAYRRDNQDRNYALRNAFFFGLGYQSAGEISAGLRRQAEKDPQLADQIAAIGTRRQGELAESDWKGLLNRMKK